MAQYSIGEAIQQLLETQQWKGKIQQIRLKEEWADIAGVTIAKYTNDLVINGTTLYLSTDIAALKNEIMINKMSIIAKINEHFDDRVVTELVVR